MKLKTHLLLGTAFLGLTPRVLLAAEEGQPGLFNINLGLSIWTVVVFVTLLLVLRRYAWGPLLEAVEARERSIQEALDAARARQEEAERLLAEQREQLDEARRKAQAIIQEGRDAAERVRKELEAKARQESDALLERALQEIRTEKEAAIDALRRESVDLALAAASRLLQAKLDPEADRRLVLSYMDELSGGEKGAEA